MQLLSIVIPLYNEEKNIHVVYEHVINTVLELGSSFDYEFIFIDDGSKDSSWDILKGLARENKKVKAIKFTRNFTQQMAFVAGYDYASGDAIITMDCDMQDTPQTIIEMVKKWQEGAYIVYARRTDRKDTFLKRVTAYWYYRILDRISDVRIPRNVGDFRLIDRKVLETVKQMRERFRYLRGLVAWTGYKHAFVDFRRPDRYAGQSLYTWSKLFKIAVDGITAFSFFPLKLACYVACFIFSSSLFLFFYLMFAHVNSVAFNSWMLFLVYFILGIQFIFFWFLGEYIGRIFDAQKNRPLYIIEETINLDKK